MIEVLDEEDRVCATMQELDDYLLFGVNCVWLVDPDTRKAWEAVDGGLRLVNGDELVVQDTPIRIPFKQVFAELDRA